MPLRGDSSLECKEARELTRGFLSGGGMLGRRAEWRAHLAACRAARAAGELPPTPAFVLEDPAAAALGPFHDRARAQDDDDEECS